MYNKLDLWYVERGGAGWCSRGILEIMAQGSGFKCDVCYIQTTLETSNHVQTLKVSR